MTSSTLRSSRFSITVATGKRVPRNTLCAADFAGNAFNRGTPGPSRLPSSVSFHHSFYHVSAAGHARYAYRNELDQPAPNSLIASSRRTDRANRQRLAARRLQFGSRVSTSVASSRAAAAACRESRCGACGSGIAALARAEHVAFARSLDLPRDAEPSSVSRKMAEPRFRRHPSGFVERRQVERSAAAADAAAQLMQLRQPETLGRARSP